MKRLLCLIVALCLLAGLCPAQAAKENDSERLLESLGPLLDEADSLTDEELAARIAAIGQTLGLTLSDKQIDRLCALCRKLAKADGSLDEKLEQGRKTVEKILEMKEKVRSLGEKFRQLIAKLRDFFARAAAFFEKVSAFFSRLSKGTDRVHQAISAAPLPPR